MPETIQGIQETDVAKQLNLEDLP